MKKISRLSMLIFLLVISLMLNLYLIYEMTYQGYQKDTRIALSAAELWANNYCELSKSFSDEMIGENVKSMHPLNNALIEIYEGKKTLYVSYMEKYRFSQNWADKRFNINECK